MNDLFVFIAHLIVSGSALFSEKAQWPLLEVLWPEDLQEWPGALLTDHWFS